MKRAYWMAAGLLGIAAAISIGLWASGFPPAWSTDKGEAISNVRLFLTAPLRIVVVGAVGTVFMIAVKRHLSEGAGKAARIAIAGVLFMPALTLFLQMMMPLMLYDVIGKTEALYGFAGLAVVFFLILGNYIVTVPFQAGIGFRNKWTLSDPQVWRQTHRFLGRSLVFGMLLTLPAFLIVEADHAVYAPMIMALLIKGLAFLYARSLGLRLALRDA